MTTTKLSAKIKKMKTTYESNVEAKNTDTCSCPSCGSKFIKKRRNQVFCRTKGGTVCRDKYWNTIDPTKRNNRTRISPASRKWMVKQQSDNFMYVEHPFSTEALGQW